MTCACMCIRVKAHSCLGFCGKQRICGSMILWIDCPYAFCSFALQQQHFQQLPLKLHGMHVQAGLPPLLPSRAKLRTDKEEPMCVRSNTCTASSLVTVDNDDNVCLCPTPCDKAWWPDRHQESHSAPQMAKVFRDDC